MSERNTPLEQAVARLVDQRIEDLIAADEDRSSQFNVSGAGIHLDYSKHQIDSDARQHLIELANTAALGASFEQLISGAVVNHTEQRSALHTLLRGTASQSSPARFAEVTAVLRRMEATVNAIHEGQRQGYRGDTLTDVVNIGIGGSDLGPRMVCEALGSTSDPMRAHFIANVDPWDLDRVLAGLNPARTLFVICSKSFTTEETLSNALRARAWLLAAGLDETDLPRHVLAVTTNLSAAAEFGIGAEQCFPIWDWVGGRYSLWSAIGLSIALQSGWPAFSELLAGAQAMDNHTAETSPADNLPMMMALLEWWHCQLQDCSNHLVLPYAQRLNHLAEFLQQLTMESNGKRVDRSGETLKLPSAPMLWGSAGTIGQHSYYQLLHQGNRRFTADIVLPLTNGDVDPAAHRKLAANALAQSRALLVGRNESEARALVAAAGEADNMAAHRVLPGNHSHSLIWFDAVRPERLGALIAAYEHKTFFLGQLLNINPFDQWGVELGKVIGKQINAMLDTGEGLDKLDPGTATVARAWRDANTD